MTTFVKEIAKIIEVLPECKPHVDCLEQMLTGKEYGPDLTFYLLNEFIKKSVPRAKNIIQAVSILKDMDDAVPAIKKAARAIYKDKIRIFFSYKLKNEEIATKIVDALQEAAGDRFHIDYAKKFKIGKDYKNDIIRATRNAHWFILLLPEQSEDWDWCLYESGLFNARKLSSDKLICIHHQETELPEQIKNYNALTISGEKLVEFFTQIFCEPDALPGMRPINQHVNISEMVKTITEAVAPMGETKTILIVDSIELKIGCSGSLETDGGLKKCEIKVPKEKTLDLFGKTDRPGTWGELITNIMKENDDDRWHKQLTKAIQNVSRGDQPKPIFSTFRGCSGKVYRPAIHSINKKKSGNIYSIQITFLEDVSTINSKQIPEDISALVTALKLGFRFRWEILENKEFIDDQISEDEIQEINNLMDRIVDEAESTGVMDPNKLLSLFDNPERREVITKMYASWERMRNKDETGELDLAMKNKDGEKIKELFKELSLINKNFLQLASKRFAELFE